MLDVSHGILRVKKFLLTSLFEVHIIIHQLSPFLFRMLHPSPIYVVKEKLRGRTTISLDKETCHPLLPTIGLSQK